MGRTSSIVDELIEDGESLATELNQTTIISHLSNIEGSLSPLSGAGAAGTVALVDANTWYAVPSSVPASNYVLVVSKENASGDLRWSFANASNPSTTYGNKFNADDVVFELAANEFVYFSSTGAGDDVNWATKII